MASFNSLPSLSTGATQGAAGGIEAFDTDLAFDESMLLVAAVCEELAEVQTTDVYIAE